MRRRDVVVPASPLVPHHEDRGRVPESTAADGVDDVRYPLRPDVVEAHRVVRGLARRRDPRDGSELTLLSVDEKLCLGSDDVAPVGAVEDVFDGAIADPKG